MTTDERTTMIRRSPRARRLDRLQMEVAISAGKLAGGTGRLLRLGGGTSLPGIVARKIDPHVLRKVVGASAAHKIVVTGSNGKTTTCRMIAAIARAADRRVIQNRAGSNLLQGVTAIAVNGANVFGHVDADMLVLEIDEAVLRHVVAEIEPDTIVVTNIFRDQMDRYGELYAVASAIEAVVDDLPARASVVLNGDDPLIAAFAPNAAARRIIYGLAASDIGGDVPEHSADTIRCVRCQHDLVYDRVYLSHLGSYRCPACGFARPELSVAVTGARPADPVGQNVELATPDGPIGLLLPLPGLHNLYNAAAAVGAALATGLSPDCIAAGFAGLRPAFGRLEEIAAPNHRIVLAMVKNPTSYNTTLRTILQESGPFNVLAAHSNTQVDGEDFAWLWDVGFESLAPRLASVVASGAKAPELALRFKYAGVDDARIRVEPDLAAALKAALDALPPGATLHILSGYTQTRDLRRLMQERGWVQPFWED